MPDIDRERFGRDVGRALARRFPSYGAAVRAWPELNKALLSRAVNGERLSPGNLLAICERLSLDPFAYLIGEKRRRRTLADIRNDLEKQRVTDDAPRETEALP